MTHPADENVVGLLSFVMCVSGLIIVMTLFGVLTHWRIARRLLPQRCSRRMYWAGMIIIALPTVVLMLLTPKVIQALAIVCSYDFRSYISGLHVVNKHGLVSDGQYLGTFWSAAIGAWILPVWLFLAIPLGEWHIHCRERQMRNVQETSHSSGAQQ
jgi:hypothetical protein